MVLVNTLSQLLRKSPSGSRRNGSRRKAIPSAAQFVEAMEHRQLLSATNDLASLSDEFDNAASTAEWQRVNEVENWNADQLQTYDINQTQSGRMVMAPHTVVWYENWRGPMAFKEVTGDFVITTQVHISDRDDIGVPDADDVPGEAQYSLGGVMIRTPRDINDPLTDWQPGSMSNDGTNNGENYIFLSMGHGTDGDFTFEVKTTRNSNSQLELTPVDSDTANLQLARIGDVVIASLQIPGQDWIVHRRYTRPDMPETMQVGLVSYTDWSKASDFTPFDHNSRVLDGTGSDPTPGEAYNPDLVAGYEFARYVRPQLPAELDGVDLLNDATDEQLLSFLGENANLPAPVDPPDDLPIVSAVAATDPFLESAGTVSAFVISRDASEIDEELAVEYSVEGTATSGNDFTPLTGTVVIPAGASSATVNVDIIDDGDVEGTESIELHLLDHVMYELGDPEVSISIVDNDFEQIDDLTIPFGQDTESILLPAASPDGTPLSYSATVVGSELFNLDQAHDFYSNGNYHENWGGQNERWIRGDGDEWFYLLPSGDLHRWEGSFESSPLIGQPGVSTYSNPSMLIDVPGSATVEVIGNTLEIDPVGNFLGTFDVQVEVSNGHTTGVSQFTVTVEEVPNEAPVITPIADQSVSHSADELRVPFTASDADGNELTFEATIVQSQLYQLDQQFEFTTTGDYHDNWGSQNERWINGNGNDWFYLLPNGQLNEWGGSFDTSSVVADLDSSVYDNPALLTDAEFNDTNVVVDGNEIVIIPQQGKTNTFEVVLTADDGLASSETTFTVDVTNAAPVVTLPSELTVSGMEFLTTELLASDADSDDLVWSVEIVQPIAVQLDTEFDLQTATDFHTNWGGQNEKWLQSSTGDWFYVLPNGDFYRWTGSFESSELLASLETEFYDDPNQIADPEPLPVSASVTDNLLTIDPAEGFTGTFQIQISVTDGIQVVTHLVNVSVEA